MTWALSGVEAIDTGTWGATLCVRNPGATQATGVRLRVQIAGGVLTAVAYPVDASVVARDSDVALTLDALPGGERVWLAVYVSGDAQPAVSGAAESALGPAQYAPDASCVTPDRTSGPAATWKTLAQAQPAGLSTGPSEPTTAPERLHITVPILDEAGLPTGWLCAGGLAALGLMLAAVWLLAGRRRAAPPGPPDITPEGPTV